MLRLEKQALIIVFQLEENQKQNKVLLVVVILLAFFVSGHIPP